MKSTKQNVIKLLDNRKWCNMNDLKKLLRYNMIFFVFLIVISVIVFLFRFFPLKQRVDSYNEGLLKFESKYNGKYFVSAPELVAVPEKFDDKKIIVQGRCSFDSEKGILYMDTDAYKQQVTRNSVKIEFSSDNSQRDYSYLDGEVVYVEGKYLANKHRNKKEDFAGYIKSAIITTLR